MGNEADVLKDLFANYTQKNAASLPVMFVDIDGLSFKFQGTGIPLARTLSPKLDKVIVLPNFNKFTRKNNIHSTSNVYLEIDSILNVQMGMGNF
jgi:hypothetical protein